MTQVNKYADRAAYAADTKRLSTKSAVSFIENESATIYNGVNTVVEKSAAAIGDLAVFDKADGIIKFIKGATIVKTQIPANLVPLAVVYARQGERVLIVSLDNTSGSLRWAHTYEVALSGFNLAAGGTAVLTFGTGIYKVDLPLTWGAGANLSDIHAQINSFVTGQIKDYGWTSSVDAANSRIIMSSNTWSPSYATIEVVSGCEITRPQEDVNYQTTLTGVLIEGAIEYIRRKNGVNTSWAGCNPEKFIEYYSANGREDTGRIPGNGEVVRESVFTEADNPALVAAYPTYRDYLLSEHMMQYPVAYGPVLRDGKANTAKIGSLRFVDIHGEIASRYPAAASALGYGVTINGATTGLEAGAWWLPSVDEIYMLMHDRVLYSADRENDPINRTLSRIGKATCYGSGYYPWTSCEYNSYGAFVYGGLAGYVNYSNKYNAAAVRPVSAL